MNFSLQYDRHDDTVDSNSLAKNNTELMLMNLTKFFDRILGALTAAPKMLAPAI